LLFKNVIFQRNYEINCTNYDKKKKRNKEIKKEILKAYQNFDYDTTDTIKKSRWDESNYIK